MKGRHSKNFKTKLSDNFEERYLSSEYANLFYFPLISKTYEVTVYHFYFFRVVHASSDWWPFTRARVTTSLFRSSKYSKDFSNAVV